MKSQTRIIIILLLCILLNSMHCNSSEELSAHAISTSSTGSSSSSTSSPSGNSSSLHFLYQPAHSPPSLSIWLQVVILHLLALATATAFYLLHRALVSRLASGKAPGPAGVAAERRYAVPRSARTSAAAASTAASTVVTPAPPKHLSKAPATAQVPPPQPPAMAKKNSASKVAPEVKQRGHNTASKVVKK